MTRDEHERRVAALKRRYPYLFAGDHLGHDIPPGWFAIVEELCARIDAALTEAEKPVTPIATRMPLDAPLTDPLLSQELTRRRSGSAARLEALLGEDPRA